MSIYRDTNTEVVFEHPHPGPLTATVYRSTSLAPILVGRVPSVAGKFSMPLTYEHTQYDGQLRIVWTADPTFPQSEPPSPLDVKPPVLFDSEAMYPVGTIVLHNENHYRALQASSAFVPGEVGSEAHWSLLSDYNHPFWRFKREQSVEVVTPLVPLSELKTVFQDVHIGDGELKELEEQVRVFIQTYTGQNFGYEIGRYDVVGNGEKKIALPKRLIRYSKIRGGPVGGFAISNNGWYLYVSNKNYLTIKEMPPEEYVDNVQLVSGVIHVPDSYWKKFRSGVVYSIEGEWGYYTVPDDIRQAALLLAKDYGSGETIYRDRYLEAMKSGDWNLVFSAGAFRGSGNKRADDLLDPYRRQGMVII